MAHHGSLCPKRTSVWSSACAVIQRLVGDSTLNWSKQTIYHIHPRLHLLCRTLGLWRSSRKNIWLNWWQLVKGWDISDLQTIWFDLYNWWTNPAPLRMPQTILIVGPHQHLGHPKWCRVFPPTVCVKGCGIQNDTHIYIYINYMHPKSFLNPFCGCCLGRYQDSNGDRKFQGSKQLKSSGSGSQHAPGICGV